MEKINFTDYSELIGKIRTQLMVDTETIMKTLPNKKIIIEDGSLSIIDTEGGVREVKELILIQSGQNSTIDVITENDNSDLSDLETDDMVAVYEFVYGEYENQLNSI
jgi:hypothetical protein